MNVVTMRAARAAQSAEQQQTARERDASARRATKAAQPAEQQQVVRERDALRRCAARVAQPVEQQQVVRERDALRKRSARAAQPAEQQQAVRERDASARQAARRGARTQRAGKQALHTTDEVEGLVVHSLGAMSHRCTHCNALRFEHEKKRTTLCCGGGKMSGLSNAFPAPAPQPLKDLLTSVPNMSTSLCHMPLRISSRSFVHTTLHYRWLQWAFTSIPRNKGSA
jgi:hypothetical protein